MRESKSKLAEVMDAVLLILVIFAVLFLVARTQTGALNSALAALAAAVVLTRFISAKSKLKKFSAKENKRMEQACTALIMAGEEYRLDYFASLLGRFKPVERGDGWLLTASKRVYCVFKPLPMNVGDALGIYEQCLKNHCKAVIITPLPPDKDAAAFFEASDKIKVLSGEKLYKLMKDSPPVAALESKTQKRKIFRKLLIGMVDRSLFRRYLFAALFLLGSSYILPQNIMYIAAGCLCLVLSLVCLFNFKSLKKKAR